MLSIAMTTSGLGVVKVNVQSKLVLPCIALDFSPSTPSPVGDNESGLWSVYRPIWNGSSMGISGIYSMIFAGPKQNILVLHNEYCTAIFTVIVTNVTM